ncbi:hypothetical protein [Aestuariivita sp.]|uniref:GTA head formation protein, RCAP_rcc01685 family n=1 Tax=Aestuariivita sp. TaxID=1872407 RepID=UPI002172B04C|nr:hypothetical protein [Aestuariivita sp.]MCE8006603.1 hypothetical protein [Aestuariivita sp.]
MAEPDTSFLCAPGLRLEAHERVTKIQIEMLHTQIQRIEDMVELIERRLWLMVYGMLAVILAETFRSVSSLVM